MENQAESSALERPQVVGNAFVKQYYIILSQAPELVHKFYNNTSVISRPTTDKLLSSASTIDDIEKLIKSLDYKNCVIELLTVDAQDSIEGAVLVLVTGFLTGKEKTRRKFTQIFFLAPQEDLAGQVDKFFVLNDVFRYMDEEKTATYDSIEADSTAATVPVTPNAEPSLLPNPNHSVPNHAVNPPQEDTNLAEESSRPSDTGIVLADQVVVASDLPGTKQDDAQAVSVVLTQNGAETVLETGASDIQDDAPKKSYASVANALNFKKQPFQQRIAPAKPVSQSHPPVPRASSPRPVSSNPMEKSSNPVEKSINPVEKSSNPVEKSKNYIVKGHSIFVANLPMNATVEQLREAFEQFGPIKSDGVQVRSYKQEKNCFGFVEFESADAMQSALKVSSIMIGNRKAHIEEKKANGDGGKNSSRRGGFRNENFRNRGNFGRGRTNGRNENENQGGFSDQVWGTTGRNGERNQKVYQNGGGRVPRQAVPQAQGGKK